MRVSSSQQSLVSVSGSRRRKEVIKDETGKHAVIMQQRLRQYIEAATIAREDIPQRVNALQFVLTMPNLLRSLRFIAKIIERSRLQMGLSHWKKLSRYRKLRRQHSIKKIQTSWRESSYRKSEKQRKVKDEEERRRRMESAARLIQINMFKRLINFRIHNRGKKRRNQRVIQIQRIFRGYVVRCQMIDNLRKELIRILRRWAQGLTDKLLCNPYLKDLHSKSLVTAAISMSVIPSHPYRQLPSKCALKTMITAVLAKQAELEAIYAKEREEHRLMMKERQLFQRQDMESTLYEHFGRACERRKRQQELEELLRIKREKMEYVKRLKRKAEQTKMYGAEQLAVIQKKEREEMFREDYRMKRYLDHLKWVHTKMQNTNWECMKLEDALGHQRREQEKEEQLWIAEIESDVVLSIEAHVHASSTYDTYEYIMENHYQKDGKLNASTTITDTSTVSLLSTEPMMGPSTTMMDPSATESIQSSPNKSKKSKPYLSSKYISNIVEKGAETDGISIAMESYPAHDTTPERVVRSAAHPVTTPSAAESQATDQQRKLTGGQVKSMSSSNSGSKPDKGISDGEGRVKVPLADSASSRGRSPTRNRSSSPPGKTASPNANVNKTPTSLEKAIATTRVASASTTELETKAKKTPSTSPSRARKPAADTSASVTSTATTVVAAAGQVSSVFPTNTAAKWKEATVRKHFKLWDCKIDFPNLQKTTVKPLKFCVSNGKCEHSKAIAEPEAEPEADKDVNPFLCTVRSSLSEANKSRLRLLTQFKQAKQLLNSVKEKLLYHIRLFTVSLQRLYYIRHELRVNKIATRLQRQQLLKEATNLENRLTDSQTTIEVCLKSLPLHAKHELELFARVFVDGSCDPTKYVTQTDLEINKYLKKIIPKISLESVETQLDEAKQLQLSQVNAQSSPGLGNNRKNLKDGDGKHSNSKHHSNTSLLNNRKKNGNSSSNNVLTALKKQTSSNRLTVGQVASFTVSSLALGGHKKSNQNNKSMQSKASDGHKEKHLSSSLSSSLSFSPESPTKLEFWDCLKELFLREYLQVPLDPPAYVLEEQQQLLQQQQYQVMVEHSDGRQLSTSPTISKRGTPKRPSPAQHNKKQKNNNNSFNSNNTNSVSRQQSKQLQQQFSDRINTGSSSDSEQSPSSISNNSNRTVAKVTPNTTNISDAKRVLFTSSAPIPGLSLFLHPHADEYDCIARAEPMLQWLDMLSKWESDIEKIWKSNHKIQVISCLQKMYLFVSHCFLESIKSTTNKTSNPNKYGENEKAPDWTKPLLCGHDANEVEALLLALYQRHISSTDCMELLLCQADYSLNVWSVLHEANITVLLSSYLCDKHFGLHSMSMSGLAHVLVELFTELAVPYQPQGMRYPISAAAIEKNEWGLVRILRNLLHIASKSYHKKLLTPKSKRLQLRHVNRGKTKSYALFSSKSKNFRPLSKYSAQDLLEMESPVHKDYPSLMKLLKLLLAQEQVQLSDLTAALVKQSVLCNSANYDELIDHNGSLLLKSFMSFQPTNFLRVNQSFEEWELCIPSWQVPVYRWGKSAGPEPFWRRLQYEQRLGIVGKYTLIDRKDNRVDTIARKLLQLLITKVLLRKAVARKLIEDDNMHYENQCMVWEDALAIRCRQKLRAKQQEQLDKQRQLQMNFMEKLFLNCRFNSAARIEAASAISPSTEAWHNAVLLTRPWRAGPAPSLQHVLYGDQRISPVNFQINSLLSLNQSQLITAEIKGIRTKLEADAARIRRMRRNCSWITGEEVYFDEHGNHRGVMDDTNVNEFSVAAEENWSLGGMHAVALAVRVVENLNVNPRGYLRCSNFKIESVDEKKLRASYNQVNERYNKIPVDDKKTDKPELVIKASPSLGNLFAPIPSASDLLATSPSRLPSIMLGFLGKSGMSSSISKGSLSEVDKKVSEVPDMAIDQGNRLLDARTGFTSCRILCEDDISRGEFATHLTTKQRMLSATAIKRLRSESPLRELTTLCELQEHVWEEFLLDRYTADDTIESATIIQGLFRIAKAKARVRVIRQANTRK